MMKVAKLPTNLQKQSVLHKHKEIEWKKQIEYKWKQKNERNKDN